MDNHKQIGGFEEAWRHQVLAGLSISPAERLHWLEEAIDFAGRAGARSYERIIEDRNIRPVTPARVPAIIREMVDRIVSGFSPEQVILFGSYARGEADKDSDVDLLVVLPKIEGSRRQKCVDIRVALHAMGLAKDIVIRTHEELEREKNIPGTIGRAVGKEGRILYERSH
ncbi:MAG: nucleotidyltransferase domain-containing protein [Elusimicrobia bacterium]|nr:nucleotidyltransferase domain-containing protein [Elusimicrobiota bacterium]